MKEDNKNSTTNFL